MDEHEYLDADGDPIVFPPDTPEEYKQQVAAQASRVRAIRSDLENQMKRLLTDCDEDTLGIVRTMLGQIVRHPDPRALAMYHEGLIVAAVAVRFDKYGFTIDPKLLGYDDVPGAREHPGHPAGVDVDLVVDVDDEPDSIALPGPRRDCEPELPEGLPEAEVVRLFEEYNLQRCTDPIAPAGFVECKGCGLVYVSLADRMLRAPDECHGCHEKAKHG
jgi:hypothetical protein